MEKNYVIYCYLNHFRIIQKKNAVKGSLEMMTPRLEYTGDYLVSGNVLVVPIEGNGKFNITLCKIQKRYIIIKYNKPIYYYFSGAKFNSKIFGETQWDCWW